MTLLQELKHRLSTRTWSSCLAIPRATIYRLKNPSKKKIGSTKKKSHRALSPQEISVIKDALHSPRFMDCSPAHVYATLLEEGIYLGCVRTMYRILSLFSESKERRKITHHGSYKKPELLATAPNQVWSWDITALRGPQKWTCFYLYVLLDIFSRYVVGWLIAEKQNGSLAKWMIQESVQKQHIQKNHSLIIHNDRGSPMKSKPVAHLIADLGLTQSWNRPHVSNDNPFSESQFKTLKYSSHFPDRFGSLQDATTFSRMFFPWYNTEHKHSSLGYHTPHDVHYQRAVQIRKIRQKTLNQAYQKHPERFVHHPPTAPTLPTAVWINPPKLTPPNSINQNTLGWPLQPKAKAKPFSLMAPLPKVHLSSQTSLRPTQKLARLKGGEHSLNS